jgi:hypothetical protein
VASEVSILACWLSFREGGAASVPRTPSFFQGHTGVNLCVVPTSLACGWKENVYTESSLTQVQGVSLAIGPKVFLITFKVIDVI